VHGHKVRLCKEGISDEEQKLCCFAHLVSGQECSQETPALGEITPTLRLFVGQRQAKEVRRAGLLSGKAGHAKDACQALQVLRWRKEEREGLKQVRQGLEDENCSLVAWKESLNFGNIANALVEDFALGSPEGLQASPSPDCGLNLYGSLVPHPLALTVFSLPGLPPQKL
jgi:hypothetical protein